jgi:hypothetical protein
MGVTLTSAGAGAATVCAVPFVSSTFSSLIAALMDRLIHEKTTNETNMKAKNECAASHNAKQTATNQPGDFIAFKTNCFGIFLSRKRRTMGCPASTALDDFRCSGEQGKTARGETLSSRLKEGVAKAALCGRRGGRDREFSRGFVRCVKDAGMRRNLRRYGKSKSAKATKNMASFERQPFLTALRSLSG